MNIDDFERPKDKVYNVFPIVDGLFSKMNYTFWDFDNKDLDVMLISHCGTKKISPIVKIAQEIEPTDPMQYLADIIVNTYKRRWDRLQDLSAVEYDPLHNFSDVMEKEITETGTGEDKGNASTDTTSNTSQENETKREDTRNNTITDSGSDSKRTEKNLETVLSGTDTVSLNRNLIQELSGIDTSTRTDNLQSKDTKNLTDNLPSTTANDVYGFNSTDAVHSDINTVTSEQTHTGTETVDNTGTQTNATQYGRKQTDGGTQSEATVYGKTQKDGGYQTDITTYGKTETGKDELNSSTNSKTSSNDITNALSNTYSSYNKDLHRLEKYKRIGNIGNITSQKMIAEEVEVWKWNFIYEVINDVKLFISIPIYC